MVMSSNEDAATPTRNNAGTTPEGDQVKAEVPRVVPLLSAVLERLILRNEKSSSVWHRRSSGSDGDGNGNRLTIFHALKPPSITVPRYLERIFRYTSCSPSCFVVGYVYIDRLVHKHPDLPITSFNVHRLLVTGVMLASKVLDDVHFNNAFFARVGGITTAELNRLELEFLFRLDFRLNVNTQEYQSYCSYLDREVPKVSTSYFGTATSVSSEKNRPFSFEELSYMSSPKFQNSPKLQNSSAIKFHNDSMNTLRKSPNFQNLGPKFHSSKNTIETRMEKTTSGSSSSSSNYNNYSSIFAANYDVLQTTPERPLYSPSR